MKTAAFYTLGCKVNTYDTEAMIELFEKAGYKIIDFKGYADVYIINTCTVTNVGDKKSRQMIRKAKRQNNNSIIVVTGCYAQTAPKELEQISEVDLIVGNKDRNKIVELIEKVKSSGNNINIVQDIMKEKEYEELKITKVKDRKRAYIKIQEGCNQFCSYCIIPYARGPIRSRKIENIVLEASELVKQGYKEVVITGINVASYGRDLRKYQLIDVLCELNNIEGIERIRLGSLEPMLLTEEFILQLKSIDKLCDHFHISLQSGSNEILIKMNRKYNAKTFNNIISNIKTIFPKSAITTDVMVGFPGETTENYNESYDFIKDIGFSKLHVFKYSKRVGTPAAKMKNQVSESIKEDRSKKLIELSKNLEREYNCSFINQNMEVLFEQKCKEGYNFYQGHTKNYILVKVNSDEDIVNETLLVKLNKINHSYIDGILI
ncbi:MAG: tRNA (N(6)-L-threonylcarbamoyladenosine(37)-C(2))-methylthiotransferase MtaB [Eubacteriaceae bacterium]